MKGLEGGQSSRRLLQSSRKEQMMETWTRTMAVEVKRVVDSRAILQVLSIGLGATLDMDEDEEKEGVR